MSVQNKFCQCTKYYNRMEETSAEPRTMEPNPSTMELKDKLNQFKLTGITDKRVELGRGAYATVIELRFRGLKCAGKRFYSSLSAEVEGHQSEALQRRWYNECALLGSLRHPNIVQFLGLHFGDSPLPMLVMEFVPFTLSRHLDKYGTFPNQISYRILVDVAKALCYLHGSHPTIIHRDLSANNVLLTSEMHAKISDLGTAKILDITPAQKANQMSVCPGTLCYMPPEALVPNPQYSTKIDCFSYGVLALHVSCGKWPLPTENFTTEEDGTQTRRTEVERRESYITMCGQDHPLMNLVQNCLSNDHQDRPDATEILEYVQRSAKQCPIHFDSILTLLEEIDKMTEQLREANSRASKQHKAHGRELVTVQRIYNQEMKKLLGDIESILNQKAEGDTTRQAAEKEPETNDSSTSLDNDIDATLIRTYLAQLVAERSGFESALNTEKAKSQRRITELENTIIQQQQNASSDLETKDKELEIKEKEVETLQAMGKAGEEELKAKSKELKFKERENQAIQKQTEVLQMLLQTQQQRMEDMKNQMEEKQTQCRATQVKANKATTQLETLQQEIDLLHTKSTSVEEGLRKLVAQQERVLDDLKGEIELMRNSEIPSLESQLETKDDIVKELLEQHRRVQEKLAKQVSNNMVPTKFLKFIICAHYMYRKFHTTTA